MLFRDECRRIFHRYRPDKTPIFLVSVLVFGKILFTGSDAAQAQVVINEVQASNNTTLADEDGDYEDWIEIYNAGSEGVNLQGYALADRPPDPDGHFFQWVFPDTTLNPGEFLLVWASGKDRNEPGRPLHTNFQISSEGNPLRLSDFNETMVDTFPPVPIPSDFSFGRYPDGSEDRRLFEEPTPGEANLFSPFEGIVSEPGFSRAPGFYTDSLHLHITSQHPGDVIHYTTDGSTPTTDSPVYTGPIPVDSRGEDPNLFSTISSTPGSIMWAEPDSPVFKGHVIRAIATREGYLNSKPATGTWFVDPEGRERYSFPVVSIVTDSVHLFSEETGIYVPGDYYDPDEPVFSGNYSQRGREWERPAHLSFFDRNPPLFTNEVFERQTGNTNMLPPENQNRSHSGSVNRLSSSQTGVSNTDTGPASGHNLLNQPEFGFSQNVGIRIHGGATRRYPQKSLRIYARSDYDWNPQISYPLIPANRQAGNEEPLETYKRFILRSSGDDWFLTMFRDALIQSLYADRNVDLQAFRPAVVFINGEYWGIHNIRERYDGWYVETNYDIPHDEVAILDRNAIISQGTESDSLHFRSMTWYARDHDLSDPEHYAYISTQMDIDNYLKYKTLGVYTANADWPHNNYSYWRKQADEYRPDAPYGADGRWRWMVFDLDATFGYPYGGENAWWAEYDHDMIEWITGRGNPRVRADWVNALFNGLIENETFRNRFISLLAGDLNTRYLPEYITELLDRFREIYEPEIEEHIHRHPHSTSGFSPDLGSMSTWMSHINVMKEFAEKRPGYLRQHLMDHFDIPGMAELDLHVKGTEAGHVRVNQIDIHPDTPGVPENISRWQGTWFQGIPVTLKPVTDDETLFLGWETPDGEPVDFNDPSLKDTGENGLPGIHWVPDGDLKLVAVFDGKDVSAGNEDEPEPGGFEIGPNYPNPFNSRTNIPYRIGEQAVVTADIYTVEGRRVKTIELGLRDAGSHVLNLETIGMASGLYFYQFRIQFRSGTSVNTPPGKMTLIR